MAKLLIHLIEIRCLQLYRILKQLGWVYSTLLLSILTFAIIILFSGDMKGLKAYVLSAIGIAAIVGIHFNRKDQLLLQSITKTPAMLYLAEYFILQFLIYCFHVLAGNWLHLLVLLATTLGIVFLTRNISIKSPKATRFKWPVKHTDFEWIGGLRRNYPMLLFMYLIALISVTVPFLSLLFVWYLALSMASFYKEGESLQILLANNDTRATSLLSRKMLAHQKNYWQFILPVLLIYSFFHWEHIVIVLILIVFISIGLIFTVVNKYANYVPEKFVGNDILHALVFGAVLIPFLAPLPILLTIRGFIKAKRNLHTYLG